MTDFIINKDAFTKIFSFREACQIEAIAREDERTKVINEVKQYLLKHTKTVREIDTKDIYDAVKIEWIIDL